MSVCLSVDKLKIYYSVHHCTIPECSRMSQNVPDCSRMFQNVPECVQIHELECSYISLHTCSYIRLHELHEHACSSLSLHAVPFFVWAAHKNFAVLVGENEQFELWVEWAVGYVVSEQSAMWWWPIRFYCHPQSPGLGIWGLGIGDRGLTIMSHYSIQYSHTDYLYPGYLLFQRLRC